MIARVGHVAFAVPDLDRSVAFAQEVIGLRLEARADGVAYLTSNRRHHQLRLVQGDAHACSSIGLDVADAATLDALAARAEAAGLVAEADREQHPGIERTLWIDVPDGPTFEVCAGVAAVPDAAYPVHGVRPKKLGHVTLAAADTAALERVLTDTLGFRVSDRIPGVLAWLRCNTDHHGIGVVASESPGLNHYAFELEGWGAFATLADHIIQHDVRLIWGPGRHGPGENLFCYYEDADGSMVECFSDILKVEDEATYRPLDWPNDATSLNRWGPGPDPAWFGYSTPFATAVPTAVAR
ncbi:MAG TPA: VOC family protein [Baekduia sp.]